MDVVDIVLTAFSAFLTSTIIAFLTYIFTKVRSESKKSIAQRKAVQALLRDRLYAKFDHCREKGFADLDDRNNFENLYNNYHQLGQNGVMDSIRVKFMALPTTKVKNRRK